MHYIRITYRYTIRLYKIYTLYANTSLVVYGFNSLMELYSIYINSYIPFVIYFCLVYWKIVKFSNIYTCIELNCIYV